MTFVAFAGSNASRGRGKSCRSCLILANARKDARDWLEYLLEKHESR